MTDQPIDHRVLIIEDARAAAGDLQRVLDAIGLRSATTDRDRFQRCVVTMSRDDARRLTYALAARLSEPT